MVGMIFIIVMLIVVLGLYLYYRKKSKSSVEHHVFENPPTGPGNKEMDEKFKETKGKDGKK
jgi:hypothetical protein